VSETPAGGRAVARPAPSLRSVAALAALELRLTARRGENVLVTLVIPVAVLLFFGGVAVPPGLPGPPVDHLLPGTIALAIVAAGLVNLGIATAYERSYGVLKRLGGAPLPRWGLVAAKVAAQLVLELVQAALVVAVSVTAFGWAPGEHWSPLFALGAIVLGTMTFAPLGLLLAGTLRAEATLAIANGLFLGFLMLGGLVVPVDQLPTILQPVAGVLPATALADLLRVALDTGLPASTGGPDISARPFLVLGAWAAGAIVLATRSFRWDA
jgi:ABC-2 type transport system permease protein